MRHGRRKRHGGEPQGDVAARLGGPYLGVMTLRAHVKGGRLVLDEPTELPEGTEVELVAVDDIDTMDDAERAHLFGFIADSIRKHEPAAGVPAAEVMADVRSRR